MGRSTISNRRTSSDSSGSNKRTTQTTRTFSRGVRSFDNLKVSSKIKNHISKIKKHNAEVTQFQEKQMLEVKLGCGQQFIVEMIGSLPEAGAYVVKDTRNDTIFIVPRDMILDKVILDPKPVRRRDRFGFKFPLYSDVPHTVDEYDDSVGHLMPQNVQAKVIYHIRDSGTKWYVLQLEAPYYDASFEENWFSGFDIVCEEEIGFDWI